MLDGGEALFLVVDDQARAVAIDFDECDAGIVDAGRRDAGEIGGVAARDLVIDGGDALARKAAAGAVNVAPPIEALEQRQCEPESGRAEPWVAWPDPHEAAFPLM